MYHPMYWWYIVLTSFYLILPHPQLYLGEWLGGVACVCRWEVQLVNIKIN